LLKKLPKKRRKRGGEEDFMGKIVIKWDEGDQAQRRLPSAMQGKKGKRTPDSVWQRGLIRLNPTRKTYARGRRGGGQNFEGRLEEVRAAPNNHLTSSHKGIRYQSYMPPGKRIIMALLAAQGGEKQRIENIP